MLVRITSDGQGHTRLCQGARGLSVVPSWLEKVSDACTRESIHNQNKLKALVKGMGPRKLDLGAQQSRIISNQHGLCCVVLRRSLNLCCISQFLVWTSAYMFNGL
jgi:hypothetical protein